MYICIGMDKKRGFQCPHCTHGTLFPAGTAATHESRYHLSCCLCEQRVSEQYLNQCYTREEYYMKLTDTFRDNENEDEDGNDSDMKMNEEVSPITVTVTATADSTVFHSMGKQQQKQSSTTNTTTATTATSNAIDPYTSNLLLMIQSETLLHETHYLLFWALDEISLKMTEKAQKELYFGQKQAAHEYYKLAQIALTQAIKLMEIQLPVVHQEKVIYYDRLAQIAIAVDDIPLAQTLYQQAYTHSCMSSGYSTPATLAIKELVDHTPVTLTDLANRYYK